MTVDRPIMWLALGRVSAAGAVALLLATPSYAQTQSQVVVSASGGYDTNPFLAFGGDRDVASFRLEMVPTISTSDGISSLSVSGRVEHVEYTRIYDSADNLSVNVTANHRLNERVRVSARVAISSSISTTDFTRPLGNSDLEPADPALPVDDDITLLGERQRRNSASAEANLDYTLSPFDQLRWSSYIQAQRYPGSTRLQDSDYASQRLSYSRQINENLSLGAVVDASVSNFKDGRVGDSTLISPQISLGLKLSPRVQLSGNFGLSFTRTKLAVGEDNSTGLAGNLQACYKGSLSNFCLNAQRQVLPSAIGGARTQSSVGASYSVRLSERETLQLGGSYAKASSPLTGFGGDFDSVRSYARYERQVTEKLRLFASAGYSDSRDNLSQKRSNVQGTIGISYKFGSVR